MTTLRKLPTMRPSTNTDPANSAGFAGVQRGEIVQHVR